ncbi:MAG TPA: histidine kinase N-terminal 7TM domain-containing protein, partial [Patescibacteria group bacterium]|nr:histidine kinase N-terminal 7TM domain-containing protein [Patescibacteria group bacterium]
MLYLSYHAIQDVWFYLLVAFVLEALAVYSWQYRKSPGALPLAGVLLNRSVWLISLVIVAISADYESKLFWVRIQQVTASLPPVLWLVFMLQMAYRWRWGNWRILAGLLFVPAIAWLLLFTNQWHGCYWSLVRFENGVLTFQRGFGNLLMVAYNFFLLPFILYYTAQWIRHCRGFRRWQVVIIVVAQLSGSVGTFLWAFTQQTGMVSPLPLSSLIAGLAWVYGFFYLRVLNRLALAQITAMEIMGNCLAVVDTEDWIVDLNAAGADTLGITPAQAVGKQAAAVFGSWPGLDKLLAKENSVTQEVCLETNAGIKY